MAFSLWKSEKEDLQAEKIKQLEEMVSTLELKINDYESALSKVQVHNNENHNDSQIADIYTRIQNIYENDESNINRIQQLESEIYSYKEVLNMYEMNIKELTSKVQELQYKQQEQQISNLAYDSKVEEVPMKEQKNIKSNGKKKRNVEFSNKNQSLFLYGNTFGETIQRISPPEKSAKKNEKNQRVKKKQKNELVSGSEYINRFYPKGETPNHVTSFNPTKYS
ncbi:hypothetical protein [Bacillus sp. J37]|uniref:hypothetical protein n=1 Tax=Bacillus sp. J37 TaxID=935837 RepID=UPI00047C05F3|nr:hypothetical protein [Bacillus sp. J37]